jgi:tRNA dimethylallyltransferase
MNRNKYLIVIGGPTASGKTGFAIRLARHFNAPILSADSRQFYRELNIGVAKPGVEELAQAPHYLIDSLHIGDEYSVGAFERDALGLLERIFEKQDIAIMAGGSGLFIKALCEGLDEFPEVPLAVRQVVEADYQGKGLAYLQAELQRIDPDYYNIVDRQNPHRLMRAIAVHRASGQPLSRFLRQTKATRFFTPIYLQMHWPRAELYERINRRVLQMMEQGLLEEARGLYRYRQYTSLQTIGYQELFLHFDGALPLENAVALIQRNSRRYAKRQLSWYRREGCWKRISPSDWDMALYYISAVMEEGWAIRHSSTAPFPSFCTLSAQGEFLWLEQGGQPAAWLNWMEKKDATIAQGPFSAGLSASRLLLHEALAQQDASPLFLFHPAPSLPVGLGLPFQPALPSVLPPWAGEAWRALQEQHPEASLWQAG